MHLFSTFFCLLLSVLCSGIVLNMKAIGVYCKFVFTRDVYKYIYAFAIVSNTDIVKRDHQQFPQVPTVITVSIKLRFLSLCRICKYVIPIQVYWDEEHTYIRV